MPLTKVTSNGNAGFVCTGSAAPVIFRHILRRGLTLRCLTVSSDRASAATCKKPARHKTVSVWLLMPNIGWIYVNQDKCVEFPYVSSGSSSYCAVKLTFIYLYGFVYLLMLHYMAQAYTDISANSVSLVYQHSIIRQSSAINKRPAFVYFCVTHCFKKLL